MEILFPPLWIFLSVQIKINQQKTITMKKLKLLLMACVLSTYAKAQTLPFTPEEVKRMMDTLIYSSSQIFIGEFTSSQSYYAVGSSDAIYTSNLVQVKSVLKGNLNPGSVQIVTNGGTIGNRNVKYWDDIGVPSKTFIFFGNDAETTAKPASNWSNSNNRGMRIFDIVAFKKTDILQPAKGSGNLFTKTKDMLDYLSYYYGYSTTYDYNARPANPGNNDPVDPTFDYSKNLDNFKKYMAGLKLRQAAMETNIQNVAGRGVNIAQTNNSLTLSFANQVETGTSPRYFEFDVMVSANSSSTYLDNAIVTLYYDVAAFGTNVVANNNITVTKGSAFSNACYFNPQTYINDAATFSVTIPFGTTYQPIMNRVLITSTPIQMMHVSMEIANCNVGADVKFADKDFTYMFSWYQPSASTSFSTPVSSYDTTYYGSGMNPILCDVNIFDFTQPIHAGVGDVLTITGTNFGATKGSGRVSFDNADGGAAINDLNAVDYISWSDTEIKIRFPMEVDSMIVPSYPGGGSFQVFNSSGGVGTSNLNANNLPFQVYYAINADTRTNLPTHVKARINLKDDNGLGGYTVRIDPNDFPVGSASRGCILKAIRAWRCLTGVNILVGNDTTMVYQAGTSDGVNYIFKKSTGWAVGQAARTGNLNSLCQITGANYRGFQEEFDMMFNSTFNWNYDTTGVALIAGEADFYATVLHEFGHAIGLGHTSNSTSELMYWVGNPSIRKTLQPNTGAADGGYYCVSNAVSGVPTNTCGNLVHVPQNSFICSFVSIKEIVGYMTKFNVYPNPVNDSQLNVSYDLLQTAKVSFKLLNVNGQEIFKYAPQNANIGNHEERLNLPNLPAGVYMLLVDIDGHVKANKIIKQ